MKKNLFKSAARVLVALLAVFGLVFGLAACAPSDEDQVKQAIDAEFAQLTKPSEDTLKESLGETYTQMEEAGIDPNELWSEMFGKLTYKIDGVTVDGDTAVATVSTENVDIRTAMTNWLAQVSTYATSEEAMQVYGSEGEDGLIKVIMGMLLDAFKDESLGTVTNTGQISLEKKDGSWSMAESSDASQILFGTSDPSQFFSGIN